MSIIEANHITKAYRLGQLHNVKESVRQALGRMKGTAPAPRPLFKALDDLSFSIEAGEVIGVIGHNGAGKSTLLKLLAGISSPTTGEVKVLGKVAPLIEVGAGLVGDLTGRENIFLNGAILGIPKAEIKRKFDEIVAFAELEAFIDTPIKRYSSGMAVRLGFAVATSVESDILIVDEVLAVGDLAFQRKCFDRMEDLIKRQGRTVLLVSHNIRQVERLCTRVMLLDHGKLVADGEPAVVCNTFYEKSDQKIHQEKPEARNFEKTDDVEDIHIDVLNAEGVPSESLEFLSPMRIRLRFKIKKPLHNITCLVGIHTTDFVYLTADDSIKYPQDFTEGPHSIELLVDRLTLLPGVYSIRIWFGTPHGKSIFFGESLATFQVRSDDFHITRERDRGLVYLDTAWHFDSQPAVPDRMTLEAAS